MTLEPTESASPDDLIHYGEQEAIRKLEHYARIEAENGDGRAARVLIRLIELAGLRRRKAPQTDDGN